MKLASCFALLVLAFLLASPPLHAQVAPDSEPTISTDRPSVTNSSVVVPKGVFQFENGMLMTDAQSEWSFDAPETLFRFGLFDKTELRLTPPDYFYNLPAASRNVSGFGDLSLGVKQQLGPVHGFDVSLIVFVSLPVGAKGISSGGYDPGVQLPWSHALSKNWTMAGQEATYWSTVSGSRNFTCETTILFDRQLTAPWDAFVEYAGDFPWNGATRQILQIGSSYKIGQRQQIDFHAGAGVSRAAPHTFIGVGYSFLLGPAR